MENQEKYLKLQMELLENDKREHEKRLKEKQKL